MRYSHQRELILEAVKSVKTHPTADMVYDSLHSENPHLSLGTVYRNLAQLCAEGKIVKIGATGRERYDIDTSNHTHFFCDECGDVYDVFCPLTLNGYKAAENEVGGEISSASITFHGICRQCLAAKK